MTDAQSLHGIPLDDRPVILPLVAPSDWRQTSQQAHDAGDQLLTLCTAPGPNDEQEVRLLVGSAPNPRMIRSHPESNSLPSLVDVFPACAWSEREIHDRLGIEFAGHEPMRPLIHHTEDLDAWTVPVKGGDTYQVAVGPIHAGIIESGHFRFHVVGEKILHVDVRLFYKHRGLEAAAAGKHSDEAISYAQRACAACNVANSVAFAHAAESAAGLWPSIEMARARTLLIELERYYNHVNDLAAICSGVGFAVGNMAFASAKEQLHRMYRTLTGHRFLFNTVAVGRNDISIDDEAAKHMKRELTAIQKAIHRAWNAMLFNASVQSRFDGVGVVARDHALQLGAVGPTARASGVRTDARMTSPRLWYSGFEPVAPHQSTGDVAARAEMRFVELEQTQVILEELLTTPIRASRAIQHTESVELGVGIVESARGQTVCVLDVEDSAIRSFHLRTSSFTNWPVLAMATPGNLLPDFPLINKSFELCYACSDR